MKSTRNKTIYFTLEKGSEYVNKVVNESDYDGTKQDCTICGDTFSVLEKMPDNSIDLLIVDPPYNLDKDFHGNNFKKLKMDDYAEYTEEWINAVKVKLKDTAII